MEKLFQLLAEHNYQQTRNEVHQLQLSLPLPLILHCAQVTGVKENERGKIKHLVFNRTEQDEDGNWVVLEDEVTTYCRISPSPHQHRQHGASPGSSIFPFTSLRARTFVFQMCSVRADHVISAFGSELAGDLPLDPLKLNRWGDVPALGPFACGYVRKTRSRHLR